MKFNAYKGHCKHLPAWYALQSPCSPCSQCCHELSCLFHFSFPKGQNWEINRDKQLHPWTPFSTCFLLLRFPLDSYLNCWFGTQPAEKVWAMCMEAAVAVNFPNPPIGNQCLNPVMKPNLVAENNVLTGPRSSYFVIKETVGSEEAVGNLSCLV